MKKLASALLLSWTALTSYGHTKVEQLLARLEKPADDYVMVVAHRGDWRNAPENSIQAIERSIQMGVDIVELGV